MWRILAVVVGALVLQITLFYYLKKLKKRLTRNFIDKRPERNNLAFVLLHKGFSADARKILEAEIFTGSPGPYVLSNLALALALEGMLEEALDKIEASLWWTQTYFKDEHSTAVALFNRSLIYGEQGKYDQAVGDFERVASNKDIVQYAEYSAIFKRHSENHPRLREILQERRPEPSKEP